MEFTLALEFTFSSQLSLIFSLHLNLRKLCFNRYYYFCFHISNRKNTCHTYRNTAKIILIQYSLFLFILLPAFHHYIINRYISNYYPLLIFFNIFCTKRHYNHSFGLKKYCTPLHFTSIPPINLLY